jgi:ribosomal subunit interface protein
MELSFTARGMKITDEIRGRTEHKLEHLEHLEPRAIRIHFTFIAEHHPGPPRATRVEAALHVPRADLHASADGPDPIAALDLTVEKLERQIRDAHGKRRAAQHRARRDGSQATPEGPP